MTRPGVVVPVRVDPDGRWGGPSPGQVRGRGWRRTSNGRYVPSRTDSDATAQRIVEAAAGVPDGALVTGWAALHWQGVRYLDGRDASGSRLPVPLAVGDRRFVVSRVGVEVGFDWLFEDDACELDGLPVTSPARSVVRAIRGARTLVAAVQVVDMATVDDVVDLHEMWQYAGRLRGRPGIVRVREALTAADENTWSPMETVARLHWTSCGLPRPLSNRPIFDADGRHLATPDLVDEEHGVVGEYDGRVHDGEGRRRRDYEVEERYRDLGLELVRLNSGRSGDLGALRQRLRAAYARASSRRRRPGWTLEPPAWWVDTSTVAARRRLDVHERARWLRWRV